MVVLRWVLAVVVGVIAYWVVLLMALGVLIMALHATPEGAGHSVPLLSMALFIGTFAAVLVAIAIAPPENRRIMGLIALAVAAVYQIYSQIAAGHGLVIGAAEAGVAILGAVLAWLLARRFFKS